MVNLKQITTFNGPFAQNVPEGTSPGGGCFSPGATTPETDMRQTIQKALLGAATAFLALGFTMAHAEEPAPGLASTEEYVTQAAAGNLFEIRSSEIALQRSRNDDVREFAQTMIEDHTESSSNLKVAVADARLPVTLPTEPDDAQQEKIGQLEDAEAGEFDRLYIQLQIEAHDEALQLHRNYAENGELEPLQEIASDAASTVESHRDTLESLRDDLGR